MRVGNGNKIVFYCRTTLKTICLLKNVHWPLTVMFGLQLYEDTDANEMDLRAQCYDSRSLDGGCFLAGGC